MSAIRREAIGRRREKLQGSENMGRVGDGGDWILMQTIEYDRAPIEAVVDGFFDSIDHLVGRLVSDPYPGLESLASALVKSTKGRSLYPAHLEVAESDSSAYAETVSSLCAAAERLVSGCATPGGFRLAVDWLSSVAEHALVVLQEAVLASEQFSESAVGWPGEIQWMSPGPGFA